MTVEGLGTTINKQFVRIFCVLYTDSVRIYTDIHFSETQIFKKTIWQHWLLHDRLFGKLFLKPTVLAKKPLSWATLTRKRVHPADLISKAFFPRLL